MPSGPVPAVGAPEMPNGEITRHRKRRSTHSPGGSDQVGVIDCSNRKVWGMPTTPPITFPNRTVNPADAAWHIPGKTFAADINHAAGSTGVLENGLCLTILGCLHALRLTRGIRFLAAIHAAPAPVRVGVSLGESPGSPCSRIHLLSWTQACGVPCSPLMLEDDALPQGEVIGIVIGAIALFSIISVLPILLVWHRRRRNAASTTHITNNNLALNPSMEQVSVERWLEEQNATSDVELYAHDTCSILGVWAFGVPAS
ncbi:hypothetical protein N7532_002583 [Penicillium argentinense]|uniref:Uncharacterized protein n=1 Tax=Penicillium argentinense TaxID=1131581 RepID=A0A9W9G0Y0_9EURO|nr:uncharacterized protein N7532_002583 [Penicillium argentinense]KAJ5109938.1 hypothetical protein N7532_002583 [Penicillium argentinense]